MLLIDPPNAPGHGRLWSHLASDTSYDELHRFAQLLGVPRRGFDRDHYDIPAERYEAVVAAGAVPVSSRELIVRVSEAGLRRRKARTLGPRRPGRTLVRPPRLRSGDTVAVVAPAGPVGESQFEDGLDVLRSWGLQVRTAVGDVHPELGYLAGTDDQRARELTRAWCDPDVRAVFCGRGGYGSQRMVDLLDAVALAEAGPKLLVGFSDITALHQWFGLRLGLATVHGPVVTSLAADAESADHLRALLFHGGPVRLAGGAPLVPGSADGVLSGGNLALLASSIGTAEAETARGTIVVLEDVAEDVYRVDRMLTQLLRSGWLAGVRGVVLGDFSDCAPAELVRPMLLDRLAALGVPVLMDAPIGHAPRNLAFCYGVPAHLDADAGTLELRVAALT
ncbi:MAG TPA: DUF4031 domain-containing protein [Nocardioidaceae bacterium]|nr:DUF4031 domain-containing protein [Nocardioidaceae bacterium]